MKEPVRAHSIKVTDREWAMIKAIAEDGQCSIRSIINFSIFNTYQSYFDDAYAEELSVETRPF